MEENEENQMLPVNVTDKDIGKELEDAGDANNTDEGEEEEEDDVFVYFKSSSIISILIIVVVSLVCILATGLLVKTMLHSKGITHTLSVYFGFKPNRTIDESKLTFWAPKSIHDEQPIETTTTIISSSSSHRPPPVILSKTEKKVQSLFRTIILPALFLVSILCGISAFYLRRHHHYYPAWGARPKRPEKYVTIELKQPQTAETDVHI